MSRKVIQIGVDVSSGYEKKLRDAVALLPRGTSRHFFVRLCATLFDDSLSAEEISKGMEAIAFNAPQQVPWRLRTTLGDNALQVAPPKQQVAEHLPPIVIEKESEEPRSAAVPNRLADDSPANGAVSASLY